MRETFSFKLNKNGRMFFEQLKLFYPKIRELEAGIGKQ